MNPLRLSLPVLLLVSGTSLAACGGTSDPGGEPDAEAGPPGDDTALTDETASDTAIDDAPPGDAPDAPTDAPPDGDGGAASCTRSPAECGALWEAAAATRFGTVLGDPAALGAFLKAVPKGADLHNHLTGAVYAETYLTWGKADGNCINPTTFAAVFASGCSASTQPIPTSGAFFDQIIRAWSMEAFIAGAENGHDHFFATFGKYGVIAGAHRDDDLADIATRAAGENQMHIETMFNLGRNVGTLAASLFSGTVTTAGLPGFHDTLVRDPGFAAAVAADVKVVNDALTGYRNRLGCSSATPPEACKVTVRFVAQVSRTGSNDEIFGQLVAAYEMAAKTPQIVALNLSSPEDNVTALRNYELHMDMLDFLYTKYTVPKTSPLHVTLHAGELVAKYLPAGYATANTFHVKRAVEKAHAERIGHGIDILSETDATTLLDDMSARGVLVEICLSSNDQILEVRSTAHPLGEYLKHKVPVALATDDQGVSRSSLAGEYARAAIDQKLDYRQLKTMARDSLEHAFIPGVSLWTAIGVDPVTACLPTATMGVGDPASAECKAFLDTSERATAQWELERRFREFESRQ